MIFCNLKVLLAQRNISISKMSEDTQISRTTLTALCSNKSSGIQFETLNTICGYLNVLPNEIILFSPYFIDFTIDRRNDIVLIKTKNLVNNKFFALESVIEKQGDSLYLNVGDDNKLKEFQSILAALPKYYISDLNKRLNKLLIQNFYDCDECSLSDFNIETNIY